MNDSLIDTLFAGDSSALTVLFTDFRNLFERYFLKHYPKSESKIPDLFQDSIMELWSQIIDGRLTKDKLKVSLATYLISIGRNKYNESVRKVIRFNRFKNDIPQYVRKEKTEEEPEDPNAIQSKKQQKELDTNINANLYMKERPIGIYEYNISDEDYKQKRLEVLKFVEEQVGKMEKPCRFILISTWYNNMRDEEIMKMSGGLYNTISAVKTRRFRCHKKLEAIIRPKYDALFS